MGHWNVRQAKHAMLHAARNRPWPAAGCAQVNWKVHRVLIGQHESALVSIRRGFHSAPLRSVCPREHDRTHTLYGTAGTDGTDGTDGT